MEDPNILGRYSIKHILLELCSPILFNEKNIDPEIPPKYKYIRNLIPIVLDLHNVQYSCWSSLFRDAALANNLLHHIDPSTPAPPPDINVSSDDYTTVWCEQDAVVLTWIYATVTPYLLYRLFNQNQTSNSTSAMEAWACLRDISQQHNVSVQGKKRRFIHIDLNEDYRSPDDGDADDDDRVDLISNLPDHLLVYILSLADDLKTAGRTSILSKRWTSLWTDLMNLDFNDLETSATIEYDCFAQPKMDKFVDWVNQVIAANRAPYLSTLRIHFPLNGFYAAHIENWLKFAFFKQVRNLELKFLSSASRIHFSKIFSDNPACNFNTTLESLHLKSVSIERPFLQWVITNCSNLQSLSIHHCVSWANNAAYLKHPLKLVITSLKLKHLEFSQSLESLKIDALHLSTPNLTSFICNEYKTDVEYRSVPSLVNVTLGGPYFHNLKALSGFSSQLEKLSIVWDELMCRKQLMEYAGWNITAASKAELKTMGNLKTVEYLGYAGCSFADSLALCFTWLAPMLRRFILDTRQPRFIGNHYSTDNRNRMKIARGNAELLAACIHRSQVRVHVVIL